MVAAGQWAMAGGEGIVGPGEQFLFFLFREQGPGLSRSGSYHAQSAELIVAGVEW